MHRTARRRPLVAASLAVVLAATSAPAALAATSAPRLGPPPGATRAAETAAPFGSTDQIPAASPNAVYARQIALTVARDTSPATVDALATRLDAAESPASIAVDAWKAGPEPGELTRRGFTALLGRNPTAAEELHFPGPMHGGSYEAFVDRLVATRSFVAHHPSLHGQLEAIYQLVLGRHVTPAEEAATLARRRAGTTLQVVAFGVTHSMEYANRLVALTFPRALSRTVPAESNGFWAHRVAAGAAGRADLAALLVASVEGQRYGCDPIAGAGTTCALPWPNDYYTVPDSTSTTGRRVALKPSFLPANASGVHISPVEPNRSNGFSPGSTLTLQVPGIDLTKTGGATVANLAPSTSTSSPYVLVDTGTGLRQPLWAELDVHGAYTDPATQLLLLHPTRNLLDGHHYVVALRNLKDGAGATLPAPAPFAAYRDHGDASTVPGWAARRAHMEALFAELGAAGVARGDLYLAWDFTVASTANITGRMLAIRDDAFAHLGTAAPSFTVTSNVAGSHTGIARVVTGTFQVPNYLTGTGAPGSTFNMGPGGLPAQNGTFTAPFQCVIPTSALTTPARPSVYGHGLFGSNTEVTAGNVQDMAAEHNVVFCATKWAGMSEDDVIVAAGVIQDLSGFPKLADRLQQGVLNTLFLGRLMWVAGGFSSDPAFQNASHQPVIHPASLYYDGNSQGGIMGGIATAVSTDWTRAVLGVSAINYSLLLPRSTDFTTFEAVMKPAYPDQLDRAIGLSVVQLEWDRAEPDGYANHLTSDPLPGTPPHTVLMQIAFGDFQVSTIAADTEARTIGAATNCPSFAPGRNVGTLMLWGVPCIGAFPYGGSAIVYWDSGAAAPPLDDVPPSGPHDPHSDPRKSPIARQQKSDFLQPDGVVTDVCAGAPCTASP